MKSPTNFRLEETTLSLLAQLANQQKTTRTDIVEQAIRVYARNNQTKKNRLLSLAGSLDDATAQSMLDDIYDSRFDKDKDFAR